jgi:hypothetical protein
MQGYFAAAGDLMATLQSGSSKVNEKEAVLVYLLHCTTG